MSIGENATEVELGESLLAIVATWTVEMNLLSRCRIEERSHPLA